MRRSLAGILIGLALLLCAAAPLRAQPSANHRPFLSGPIWVYNNWSSYDELSDDVPLTEAAAMHEFGQVLRLRRLGVHIDYYVMDAFWYDPDGGYRKWRSEGWPDGPEHWLGALEQNGVLPGLWFSTNSLAHLYPAPQWKNSLSKNGGAMALYTGGFLPDFMDVLQYWYNRGVRLFKFDFADLTAAAKGDETKFSPAEIREKNIVALRAALIDFRARNPDVVLVGFNGFGGDYDSTAGPLPFADPLDPRWFDVFDSVYAGDPRPSDVPEFDFWRSMDIYSDHAVRRFAANGIPLRRIDSTSFMVGDTGTNYHRRTGGWKGMLLLEMARGGWVNTLHGNLELLSDSDGRWFARAQKLYAPLQQAGSTTMFGGIPGAVQPYGFASERNDGALYAVVNPAQSIETVALPPRQREEDPHGPGRVLFRDSGFEPVVERDSIRLGPGQLALIGFGRYASAVYDLGVQADIRIPRSIAPVAARFVRGAARNTVEAVVLPPASGDLRIVMQQRDLDGHIMRSMSKTSMAHFFVIAATQGRKTLRLHLRYDHAVWSGLSWAVAEIHREDMAHKLPIRIRLSSADTDKMRLDEFVYNVIY